MITTVLAWAMVSSKEKYEVPEPGIHFGGKQKPLYFSISCYRPSYNDKWEHQLDETIKYIFHLKLVSTCFGRDIVYHREITQLYISAYGNRPCN